MYQVYQLYQRYQLYQHCINCYALLTNMSTHTEPALMLIFHKGQQICAGTVASTNPAMVDTRSRTMARSVSPMLRPWLFFDPMNRQKMLCPFSRVAVPLEQYYSRSRHHLHATQG